jgi:hypothetical protein
LDLASAGGRTPNSSVVQPIAVSLPTDINVVLHCELKLKLKLKLIYDRQSVDQYVLVPGSHLGPMTRFLLSLTIAGFLILGTLSDERMGL